MKFLKYYATIFSFLCIVNTKCIKGQVNYTDKSIENNILNEWKEMDNQLKNTARSLIKNALPIIMESADKVNLSRDCVQQVLHLIKGLRNMDLWAVKFVDSSSKIPDGLLSGTVSSFGVYEECVENSVPDKKDPQKVFYRGQYCSVDIRPPLPTKKRIYRVFDQLDELKNFTGTGMMTYISKKAHLLYVVPINIGLCVPSGCSKDDLQQIATLITAGTHLTAKVDRCDIIKETHFDAAQVVAITISSFLACLVIAGTSLKWYSDKRKQTLKSLGCRILLCFSATTNFKNLVSTKTSTSKFQCLYGIRFLSVTWVCFGHAYSFPGFFISIFRSLFNLERVVNAPAALTVTNSSEVIDTFLFLGGMLVSYNMTKVLKIDKRKFKYGPYVLHRICRIIPGYYFIILMSFLTPLMGSGPMFHQVLDRFIYPCYESWWKNIIFINNFFEYTRTCNFHTWYIACDMQLYLVAPIVILLLIRSEKIGLFFNFLIIAATAIYSGLIVHMLGIGSAFTYNHFDDDDKDLASIAQYMNPLSRGGPYFIGVFIGYILITRPDLKIPKKYLWLGWITATMCCASVIYSVGIWTSDRWPKEWENVVYGAFSRVLWASGVAWMTLCCVTGHGGFINDVLSWKFWVPLGKLSFLIYCIQPIFQTLHIAVTKITPEITHLNMIVTAFGVLCIASLLALLCNLLVESPFISIEKLLLESPKSKEHSSMDKKSEIQANGASTIVDLKLQINGSEVHKETSMNNKVVENVA